MSSKVSAIDVPPYRNQEDGQTIEEQGHLGSSDQLPNLQPRNSIGSALARHETIDDAESLASIDRPPEVHLQPSKVYHPFSLPVLALLAPASMFGVLARLGLLALMTYDGRSIFPLAYVQAGGCLIMGFGLGLKQSLGRL
jgi:fluoride exporter